MYNALKGFVLRFLKVPSEPADPMGDVESLVVFRASPNFFKYKLYLWIARQVMKYIGLLVGVIVLIVMMFSADGAMALLFAALVVVLPILAVVQTAFSYVMLRLDYEMRWYKVTDRSLRIREGVWLVREMTMTFDNIQNISVTQGPIQRLLNIADLRVQTAGGGGAMPGADQQSQYAFFSMHTGYFRGIDNAEGIKQMMQQRLRLARTSGLGDLEEPEPGWEAAPSAAPATVDTATLEAARDLLAEVRAFRAAAQRLAPEPPAGWT